MTLTRDAFLTFEEHFDGDFLRLKVDSNAWFIIDLIQMELGQWSRQNNWVEKSLILFELCWTVTFEYRFWNGFSPKGTLFPIHHDIKWTQRRFLPFWQIDWVNLSFSNKVLWFNKKIDLREKNIVYKNKLEFSEME